MKIIHHNVRSRPSPLQPHCLVAVLVQRAEGVCSYEAILPDRGDGWYDLDFVARQGDKLTFEQALEHFPIGLSKAGYV